METPGSIDLQTVRCPTCRASQPWSDTCRRCKSDLRLLGEFARAYDRARVACLDHLHHGRVPQAAAAARRCLMLSPDPTARRLSALAALRAENWAQAALMARTSLPE